MSGSEALTISNTTALKYDINVTLTMLAEVNISTIPLGVKINCTVVSTLHSFLMIELKSCLVSKKQK